LPQKSIKRGNEICVVRVISWIVSVRSAQARSTKSHEATRTEHF
jgi:hypothetical protein